MLRDKRHDIWYVKVSCEKGKMDMKDGWEIFCKEHGLKMGDFLVFKYQGNLIFDVIIFDPSASERKFPQTPIASRVTKIDHISKGRSVAKMAFKPRGFPYCHISVKPHCFKWGGLIIPIEFARANGIDKRRCKIKVNDERGRSWSMQLKYRRESSKGGNGVYISSGWCKFYVANGLKSGDQVIIELIDSGPNPVINFY
ncbi:putative B3 domain-containing protein REM15 [Silene latifolia]|uniref:putative B3 domain-containing protein REM15 n=1 Tax=Silene latifolia TaxID=37657 RepID=UPI003D78AA96